MNIFFRSFLGAAIGGLLNQIIVFLMRTQMTGWVPDMILSAALRSAHLALLFAVSYTLIHLLIGKPTVLSSLVMGMIFAVLMAGVAYRQDAFDLIPLNYVLTVMFGLFIGGGAAALVLDSKAKVKDTTPPT